MCGIFGVLFMNGCLIDDNKGLHKLITTLFKETSIRGPVASGISIVRPHTVPTLKKDVSAKEFVESDSYKLFLNTHLDITKGKEGPISVFGHCRYPTKGSEKINDNNHPIIADQIVGIHNGTIGNDDELFNSYMSKHLTFKRQGQVDSEIIFRLLNHYIINENIDTVDAIKNTTKELSGNYACAFINALNPYNMWLFRNYNPIMVLFYSKAGIIIFASVKNHITVAVESSGLTLGTPIDLDMENNELLGFDLFSNTHIRSEIIPQTNNFMGHA